MAQRAEVKKVKEEEAKFAQMRKAAEEDAEAKQQKKLEKYEVCVCVCVCVCVDRCQSLSVSVCPALSLASGHQDVPRCLSLCLSVCLSVCLCARVSGECPKCCLCFCKSVFGMPIEIYKQCPHSIS